MSQYHCELSRSHDQQVKDSLIDGEGRCVESLVQALSFSVDSGTLCEGACDVPWPKRDALHGLDIRK